MATASTTSLLIDEKTNFFRKVIASITERGIDKIPSAHEYKAIAVLFQSLVSIFFKEITGVIVT
jgi:hypothetical protein